VLQLTVFKAIVFLDVEIMQCLTATNFKGTGMGEKMVTTSCKNLGSFKVPVIKQLKTRARKIASQIKTS